MAIEKFENEKFILNFEYDEKLEKFLKMNFQNKKLNELENKILDEICSLFTKCNLQELYEHLIIRVENKLRDFKKVNYDGIVFAENLSSEYKYFKNFFREFLKPYIKKDLKKSINFQTLKPDRNWLSLSIEQQKEKIYAQLEGYSDLNHELVKKLKVIRIVDKVDIYIELPTISDINSKNKLCLDIEIYLKKNLDESLNIYLETAMDKNKIRRLSL